MTTYRLDLTKADFLLLLSTLHIRCHDLRQQLANLDLHDFHADIRDEHSQLMQLVELVFKSSTAPAATMPGSSFDGAAGAAGGAE